MGFRPHYLLDVLVGSTALLILAVLWYLAPRFTGGKRRVCLRVLIALCALLVAAGVAMAPVRISSRVPSGLAQWTKGIGLLIAVWTFYSVPVLALLRVTTPRMPERRRMLRAAAGAALALPALVVGTAYIRREDLHLREFDIAIPNLPKDLQGLRIVQLSDIHLGAFVRESLLVRSIAMANETKAHIALVTGDLVSVRRDPLDLCLQRLAGLRSDAGTYGCLGNHEIYAYAEAYTAHEGAKLGMRFLRRESELLKFGNATLNLAGVDYQRKGDAYLVGAENLIAPGAVNLLLSHNPDVFPVAARQGWDLTMSGHTHGGQVNVEILHQDVNLARFFTPYIYGRYERHGKSVFVTRGIGTVGAPARLGAPPEVALIRLCAS